MEQHALRGHDRPTFLGGPAWTLRDFYTAGGLVPFMKYEDLLHIVTLEQFIARANRGEL